MPAEKYSLKPTKQLDAMNRLSDMGRFPIAVNAGATLNVLATLGFTWWVHQQVGWRPLALPALIAAVLLVNLMPVVGLRAMCWRAGAPMPAVEEMDFFGDQHRFSDWVYLAASANMAFWIALGWVAFTLWSKPGSLVAMLVLAFICTFAPVWLRVLRGERER